MLVTDLIIIIMALLPVVASHFVQFEALVTVTPEHAKYVLTLTHRLHYLYSFRPFRSSFEALVTVSPEHAKYVLTLTHRLHYLYSFHLFRPVWSPGYSYLNMPNTFSHWHTDYITCTVSTCFVQFEALVTVTWTCRICSHIDTHTTLPVQFPPVSSSLKPWLQLHLNMPNMFSHWHTDYITCTVSTRFVQFEALVTVTPEHAEYVLTFTVDTQVQEQTALIDICERKQICFHTITS